MKTLLFLIGISIAVFLSACNDNSNCDTSQDCNTIEPDSGYVHLHITINDENPLVPITVYYGYPEDNDIYFRDTVNAEDYYYTLEVDERYSVEAKYKRGNQTIIAVDGGRLDVTNSDNCNETCYEVQDLNLKLQLK
jgi:hypothetical protein